MPTLTSIEKQIANTQSKLAELAAQEAKLLALYDKEQKKAIKASNAAFNKLKAADKRVAVAKDVLAQIKLGALVPEAGKWAELEFNERLEVEDEDSYSSEKERLLTSSASAQDAVVKAESCNACALGAVFVSAIRLGNKLTCGQAGLDFDGTVFDLSHIENHLSKFFEPEQLALMEIAFEQGDGAFGVGDENVDEESEDEYTDVEYDIEPDATMKAIRFTKGINSPKKRMKKIMNNINANKGTFVP